MRKIFQRWFVQLRTGLQLIVLAAGIIGCGTSDVAAPIANNLPFAIRPRLASDYAGLDGPTCSLASIACGYSKAYNFGSTWEGEAMTYFNTRGVGAASLVGYLTVYRGSMIIASGLKPLLCATTNDQCFDWASLVNTCATEYNRASVATVHTAITIFGIVYKSNTSAQESCRGPEGGTGGGPSGGGIECHSEWQIVEISYNNGLSWTTIWSGYVDVCG